MVGALALAIYALNQLTDRQEDRRNDPLGADARVRGGAALLGVAAAAMLAGGFVLAREGRLGSIYGLILAAGVLYSCPVVPWYRRGSGLVWLRLKAVPLIKNLTIGVTWAAAVFLVPLLDGPGGAVEPTPRFVLLAVSYAVLCCMNSVFGDLRDADGDRAAGVITLAVRLGVSNCYRWVAVVSLVWVAYVAGTYVSSTWIDTPHFVFLCAAALGYPLAVGAVRERLRPSRAAVDLVVESADVVFAVGVLALAPLS